MVDSDSDVILINSDDSGSSSCSIKSAAARRNDVLNANQNDKNLGDDSSILSSAASAPSVAHRVKPSAAIGQKKNGGSIVDVDACSDLDNDDHDANSSSSSLSSGIPSPWKTKSSPASDRPPSIIHTRSPTATNAKASKPSAGRAKPAKRKCLTDNNKTINKDDEMSRADMSTTSSLSKATKERPNDKENDQSKETRRPAKKRKPKTRQWGYNRKRGASKTTTDGSISGDSSIPSTVKTRPADDNTADKHFHCYLLRSLDPDHPLKTYIGFTTNPQRRIRQHNGILKNGGALRTKRAGRPWTFVCVIHGFQDKITALQFEWAWQNVDKSKSFREAVGCDTLAKKIKRRMGPKARLDELRILLKECLPFCLYSLTVYFPEEEYHDIFSLLLMRGKNGNPYKKDEDDSEAYEPLTNFEVCSLENMPFAKEAAALKEKKMAKREAEKAQKNTKTTTNYGSDISEWLESAKLALEEESYWSDLLDDDDDDSGSKCSNLKTIAENNNSSFDLCNSSTDGDGKSPVVVHAKKIPLGKPSESHHHGNDMDDISKDFLSLSIDASKKYASKNTAECDFSTISSADSTSSECSLGNDHDNTVATNVPKRVEKENQQPSFDCAAYSFMNDKATNAIAKYDVVDLCDSP